MNRFYLKSIISVLLILGLLLPSFASASASFDTGEKDAIEQLNDQYKDIDQDTSVCKPDQPGQNLFKFPNNMSRTLGKGLQKKLGQTIGKVVKDNLSQMV